jgi:hypothetical protein
MLSGVRALFNTADTFGRPLRNGWEIYGDQVYTNEETVYIDYQSTLTRARCHITLCIYSVTQWLRA